ncbi:MAG: protein-L-isoaspartate(D-aspartate) O-methyltransferase [Neptuniibacter sp.]
MTSQRTRDRLINRLREQGINSEDVLSVMRETPRHIFIDEALAHRAYEDTALPIGYNQTISQPFIVARMTETLLAAGPLEKVLEVGTGSGYQTSILAPLVAELYSVERIRPLQEKARNRLRMLGIKNVNLKHTDGGMGWAAKAPFDGILAACAPEDVPEELMQQLAVGGRLIIPVGGSDNQELKLVVRESENEFSTQVLECVKFVPLLSGTIR